MTADALKKITTDALDKLAALLDEGHSDQLTALLKTMAQFHRYSFNNVCLIVRQRPEATRVAGFHAWRKVDCKVGCGALPAGARPATRDAKRPVGVIPTGRR